MADSDVISYRCEFHVHVGIETEVPEVALFVGKYGGPAPQNSNRAPSGRGAVILLGETLGERVGDVRATSLSYVVYAGIDDLLEQ